MSDKLVYLSDVEYFFRGNIKAWNKNIKTREAPAEAALDEFLSVLGYNGVPKYPKQIEQDEE